MAAASAGIRSVIFGTGCFWGSEKGFWRMGRVGVVSTSVGYAGGHAENPTYKQVCTGRTNHNEVVQVVYDENRISFSDLLRQFWQSHDPTQGNRQGNDAGTQYRSGVYCTTEEQLTLAKASKESYEKSLGRPITTEILGPAQSVKFWPAEDYHQQYLAKPGSRPYCSAQPTGVSLAAFDQWAPAGMESHKPKLPESFWE